MKRLARPSAATEDEGRYDRRTALLPSSRRSTISGMKPEIIAVLPLTVFFAIRLIAAIVRFVNGERRPEGLFRMSRTSNLLGRLCLAFLLCVLSLSPTSETYPRIVFAGAAIVLIATGIRDYRKEPREPVKPAALTPGERSESN